MNPLKSFYLKMKVTKKYRCNRDDNLCNFHKHRYYSLPFAILWIVKKIHKIAPCDQGI